MAIKEVTLSQDVYKRQPIGNDDEAIRKAMRLP